MQLQFETGATNQASNNLVLSVLNDGAIYNDRLTQGYALLQGIIDKRFAFVDIVKNEANKQRYEFGSKFKSQEISEAVKIVQTETLDHCIEQLRDDMDKNRPIIASCRHWRDKVNGNSYFSVNLRFPCGDMYRQINTPMQYGYGSQWQYEVINFLSKHGFIPKLKQYSNGNFDYGLMSDYERDNVVIWLDEGYGLKRNMYQGSYL